MKLIIDIDESYYKIITNKVKTIRDEISKNGYANNDCVPIGWNSIADGTLVLKEHGDLIDSNVLCEQYERTNGDLYQALDLTPIIIEAERRIKYENNKNKSSL